MRFGKPAEFTGKVTEEAFRNEIYPGNRPVLLKGQAEHWPAVRAGLESPDTLVRYLKKHDLGKPVDTNFGHPDIRGRFFYNERLDGLNFTRKSRSISGTMDRILATAAQDRPQAIYIQSVPIAEHLPGFEGDNAIGITPPSASARIWIGNRAVVQCHFDLKENIAAVVAGRRRFTLFPPGQTPNLYPGPFELTMAGPPVSMADFTNPDFDTHPRFREAMQHALVADMEPGDALYIPYFWWHHVEALDDFNVLVNYWWNDADPALGVPFDAMLHSLLTLRDLPKRQRDAWKVMFDHYVFQANGDPLTHLPEQAHGTLGRHDARTRQQARMILLESLARQAGLKPSSRN